MRNWDGRSDGGRNRGIPLKEGRGFTFNKHKEVIHTALRDFDIYSVNAPENSFARHIRAQFHLSSNWRFTGMKTVRRDPKEYSDDHPDERKAVEGRKLKRTSQGTTYYYVTPLPRRTYRCPACGAQAKPVCYRTRTLNHVPDKDFQCIVVANLPKLGCDACGGTRTLPFPAAGKGRRCTRQLEEAVLAALKDKTRSATADEFFLHWSTVDSILDRAVSEAVTEQDLSYVTGVYVDETQFGRGQDYVSVFLDQRHRVIYACRGHGTDVLERFRDHLVVQGGDPESVRFFSADMSAAYESGITECFPNALLVWDRFHLAKSVDDTVDSIRKTLLRRKKGEALHLTKYTVLTREGNMDRKKADRMNEIRLHNPLMALAYDMKEVFLEIIRLPDRAAMERLMLTWIEWVECYGDPLLKKKAERFGEKLDRILAWTVFPVSNSVSEGVNKNIQDIRRQACGYRDAGSFFNMILLRQGDLVFRI